MKEALGRLIELVYAATKTAKVRKRLMGIVAALVILQLYFVRELIAAELLFGIGFSVILVLAGILYLVGAIAEQGWDLTEAGARVIARSARRSYNKLSPIIGALTVQGWELAEARTRAFARSARRGYNKLEEVSKRQFRHPRSESAR